MKVEVYCFDKNKKLVRVEETDELHHDVVIVRLIDDEGHVEEFAMDYWQFVDKEELAKILHNWITKIFNARKQAKRESPKIKKEKVLNIAKELKDIAKFIANAQR